MPIRMVKDDNGGSNQNRNIPNIGGGGSGGSGCLTALLPLLIRNPKILIPIVVIGVIFYFLMPTQTTQVANQLFATGGQLSPTEFKKEEIFAPLADNAKNPLPEKVSLEQYCPPRKNQGQQGSCVGWSSSYAARTILYARQFGKNPAQVAFSPSSLYNQIKLQGCQGAYLHEAMKTMKDNGVLPFNEFPYDESTCSIMPDNQDYQRMQMFRIAGSNRLTKGSANSTDIDLLAIKQNLAQGAPVVIGMMVGGTFMSNMMGQDEWHPNQSDYYMQGFGGHAMCVIGYDDYKNGGSFEIMNSWGSDWGNNGFAYVNYEDFAHFTKEAYGLYPMGNANEVTADNLKVQFGLVNNDTKQNIAFQQVNGNLFKTTSPIKIGDKFKIEVTNNIPCYTYVFGQETDGSNYTLFPYTQMHSPYCGITGTRLFPNDYSMQADDVGNSDFMAVIISQSPMDYVEMNNAINGAQGSTYQQKINNAFAGKLISNIAFKSGQDIQFDGKLGSQNMVAVVMQIDKR